MLYWQPELNFGNLHKLVTKSDDVERVVEACMKKYGR